MPLSNEEARQRHNLATARWYLKNKERHAATRRIWNAKNRERRLEVGKKWKINNKARVRETNRRGHYMRKFGLKLEDLDLILAKQNGRCAICATEDPGPSKGGWREWHIDHCHGKKVIRGLLCRDCNLMLGHAKDNPTTLCRAAEYITQGRV